MPNQLRGKPPLRLHLLRKVHAELGDFGIDHGLAVALRRVAGEVFLVIVLGDVEGLGGDDLGDDRPVEDFVIGEAGDHGLGDPLLLRRVAEDRRAVLRARVVALVVELGRVVDHEEDLEQLAIGHGLWIERNLHHFGVAGSARADRFVGRIGRRPAHVAGLDRLDPAHLVVHRFETPETAARQRGDLFSLFHGSAFYHGSP